jgi:DNA-binding IclR family transcriptional regulator
MSKPKAVSKSATPVTTVEVEQADSNDSVRSVLLVLKILEALAIEPSYGVTALAMAVGATKARVHRHLRTLLAAGYAAQESGGERYAAGPRLIALGRNLSPNEALLAVAKPAMRRLRDKLGHTVTLAKISHDAVTVIDASQGSNLFGIFVALGQNIPLHAVSAGKVALAFGPPELKATIQGTELLRYTDNTITDMETLELELERIRRQGWAISPEECVIGINSICAPIFGPGGVLVASISIVNSLQFIARQPSRNEIGAVVDAAKEITDVLALK